MRQATTALALLVCLWCRAASSDPALDTGASMGDDVEREGGLPYVIVDPNPVGCTDRVGADVACGGSGQDGAHSGNAPASTDNGDGSVRDNVGGLGPRGAMPSVQGYSVGAQVLTPAPTTLIPSPSTTWVMRPALSTS